jgi:hypothetical protein
VTSDVNTLSCLIIAFTIFAERRNSPLRGRPSTSRGTVCCKSPCATAVIACVTAVVGQSRSSIRALTEPSISPHALVLTPSRSRLRVLPSRPTVSPTCSSCCAILSFAETMSLNVSAILPARPTSSVGSRAEKSPARTACKACNRLRRYFWSGLPSLPPAWIPVLFDFGAAIPPSFPSIAGPFFAAVKQGNPWASLVGQIPAKPFDLSLAMRA